MAINTGKGTRKGATKNRSQIKTSNGVYMKRDAKTGKFISGKKTPYKGVRKEKSKK